MRFDAGSENDRRSHETSSLSPTLAAENLSDQKTGGRSFSFSPQSYDLWENVNEVMEFLCRYLHDFALMFLSALALAYLLSNGIIYSAF